MITTKYYGPTNTKGARIKVTDSITGKGKFYPFDHSAQCPHEAAFHQYIIDTRGEDFVRSAPLFPPTFVKIDDGKAGYVFALNPVVRKMV
jgi:hypothetical protein